MNTQSHFVSLSSSVRGLRFTGILVALLYVALSYVALSCALAAQAQLATGDARGAISEPVFPTVCAMVTADLSNVSGEPSSETNTATDTAALQAGLTTAGCAGNAVEVVAGVGGQNAMVIAPIYVPAGVTLLVDGGVTLFGSRNAADYQIGTTGTGNACGSTDGARPAVR